MNINLTLLMQAVAFFAFILFTAKFIWPPLMRAIDTRQKQIADGLAAGEEGRHSLVNAEKRIAEMMVDAKTRASEIVAQARIDAKTEADRILAAAKAEIEQEVNRAKESLRAQVSELAVAGAEKILKREVDAKAHAELLSALEKQL